MPITMEIRENGYVAYYVMSDPWVTNDLTSLYPQDIQFRDSVNHLVHTFMDVSQVRRIPPDVIRARINAPAFIHRNSGHLIMIGAKSLPKIAAETIFRIARYERAKFFDTEEQGWAFTRQLIAKEQESVSSRR